MGFHHTVFTQAGCSFLFLLPADHKDISFRPHHDALASRQRRYCTGRPRHSYHHILAKQTAHHTDTIRI